MLRHALPLAAMVLLGFGAANAYDASLTAFATGQVAFPSNVNLVGNAAIVFNDFEQGVGVPLSPSAGPVWTGTASHHSHVDNYADIVSMLPAPAYSEAAGTYTFDFQRHLDIFIQDLMSPPGTPFIIIIDEEHVWSWFLAIETAGPDGVMAQAETDFQVINLDGTAFTDRREIHAYSAPTTLFDFGSNTYVGPSTPMGPFPLQPSQTIFVGLAGATNQSAMTFIREFIRAGSGQQYWSHANGHIDTWYHVQIFR